MSRPIKFNVYDKKFKQYYLYEEAQKTGLIKSYFNGDTDVVMLQYIGLKDKNGREINEGDILNFEIRGESHGPEREYIKNAPVWYSEEDCMFCFGRYKNDKYEYWYSFADEIDKNTIEIIGNIYQNSELLK